jgi:hypothetical protein
MRLHWVHSRLTILGKQQLHSTSAIVWSLLRQVSVTVRGDRTGGNAASVVDSVLVFDEGREVKTVSELVLLYNSGLGVQASFGEFGLAGQ